MLKAPAKSRSRSRIPANNGEEEVIPGRVVGIPKLEMRIMEVGVIGVTPLITHAWSEKAIRMILNKQEGKGSAGQEAKNPLEDFRSSVYYLPNKAGLGIPSPCFKAAIVTGANDVGMKMTEVKRSVHVSSYLTKIDAPPLAPENYTEWDKKYEKELAWHHAQGCQMRLDMVRLSSGVADVRFRGCFPVWSAKLEIEFNVRVVRPPELVSLIQAAGLGGVCEWRPSSPMVKSGEFGRFRVDLPEKV